MYTYGFEVCGYLTKFTDDNRGHVFNIIVFDGIKFFAGIWSEPLQENIFANIAFDLCTKEFIMRVLPKLNLYGLYCILKLKMKSANDGIYAILMSEDVELAY